MYVQRNMARSGSHCCSGKAVSVTCCEYVFVALVIQHPVPICHIVKLGLPRCTEFSHITSKTARFWKKKVTEHNMCVLMFCTSYVRNISRSKKK